ncbi:uncharacterized protein LOC125164466 isoform X7 [Prionailurus viverrinus]|uniref:uncharacterized protein LOC125164466 isoform X7 n=1 Tax=Prionailurus viverrinus TaxID=61388 RepID=UPI001FF5DB7C|nr:uncharacterized protein LOC125164466 isoform X7 [Prionailurus viverrinus]
MSQLSPSAFSFHEESVPAAATGRDACVLDERCVEPAYRPGKRPHSQKESLQVSASSGEMQVRPQNCTGTNSSLNLVLITTWVLTEQPEECNPAHPVAARWSARNQRNVEEGQPPSRRVLLGPYCFPENQAGFPSQGPTRITPIPFLGLGVLLIKRACGPRKSWPDWLKPASCTVLLPLTSSPPTGQTTPALGHQLGGPTERKLCKALPRCLLHHVHRPPVLHPCGALCKAWPLSYKAGRDGAWGRCYGWLRGYLRRRDSGLGSSPSTCLVLGTDRDVHRDPVALSACRQVRTATWVTSCDPRASGRWERALEVWELHGAVYTHGSTTGLCSCPRQTG